MAVISSMLAMVVLPSAFAQTSDDPEVSAEIGTADLTLTGAGSYSNANGVTLRSQGSSTGLVEPPIADTVTYFDASRSADYIRVRDGSAVAGYDISLYMTSSEGGDFVYAGTAGSSPANDIPVANFVVCPEHDGSTASTATVGTYSSGAFNDTASILTTGTADSAENPASVTFDSQFTSGDFCNELGGGSVNAIDYASSNLAALNQIIYQLARLELTVPDGSPAGTYSSTLFILASE